MISGYHGNNRKAAFFDLQSHIHDYFINPAVGKDQETVRFLQYKIAQDHFGETLNMFEEHGLSLAICSNNGGCDK